MNIVTIVKTTLVVGALAVAGNAAALHPRFGHTELHHAAMFDGYSTVKRLLERGADVNARDDHGDTPLDGASTAKIAALLIEHGADVNARDDHGYTLLHDADDAEIATVLIEHGADVNARSYGQTPLEWRIELNEGQKGRYDAIIAVLRTHPVVKAAEEKRIAAEKLPTLIPDLIARGAVNERDADTNTALHLAAKNNKSEYVTQLIEAGADVNIINKKADTPLHLAVRAGARDATVLLLRAGGNPYTVNLKGESALAIVVESGDEDLMGDLVLEGVDVAAIANLRQEKAQRDWEAQQERQ